MFPLPLTLLFAALFEEGEDERETKARLAEVQRRLGALPTTEKGGLNPRLAGLRKQYGEAVYEALLRRLIDNGIDPTREADVASIATVLPWLARTIKHNAEPVGSSGHVHYFLPDTHLDLRNLAALVSTWKNDLLSMPSWREVLAQLHQAERQAGYDLQSALNDQRFTRSEPPDPVQSRVLDWLTRAILAGREAPFPDVSWIADWVRGENLPPGRLESYSPEGATVAAAQWHGDPPTDKDAWEAWRSRVRLAEQRGWRPTRGEIIREWSNGWSLQSLSAGQLPEESLIMGHCVGWTEQPYTEKVKRGAIEIWSLRNDNAFPVATLEIVKGPAREGLIFRKQGTGLILSIPQVNGPGNRAMHPAHRAYFWDTFKDHLSLLPPKVQSELIAQFVTRSSPEFQSRVLSSPEAAFLWAKQIDKGSRPDTKRAALKDPKIAIRWAKELDQRPGIDTFLAILPHPAVHQEYLQEFNYQRSERIPDREIASMKGAVQAPHEAAFLASLLHYQSISLNEDLIAAWIRDPQFAALISGTLIGNRANEQAIRKELGMAANHDVEQAIADVAYRDPWAAVTHDQKLGDATREGIRSASQNPAASLLYLKDIPVMTDESMPLFESILDAPEGPPDTLPAAVRASLYRRSTSRTRLPYVGGSDRPSIALNALILASSQFSHIHLERVHELIEVAKRVPVEAAPGGWGYVLTQWPLLLSDPDLFARLTHPETLLTLEAFSKKTLVTFDLPRVILPALQPGTPLRKALLKRSTGELLVRIALNVDLSLRPDIAKAILRANPSLIASIVRALPSPTRFLDPELRRTIGFYLPPPDTFTGWNHLLSKPEDKREWGHDAADLWQETWIRAQIATAIHRLRKIHARSPLLIQRRVEEAIGRVTSAGFQVGASPTRSSLYGPHQSALSPKKPDGTDIDGLNAELRAARLPPILGLRPLLTTTSSEQTNKEPLLGSSTASSGKPPDYVYLGMTGGGLGSTRTIVAPLFTMDPSSGGTTYETDPTPWQAGISRDDPKVLALLERLRLGDPEQKRAFARFTGQRLNEANFGPNGFPLRALFLAATPYDAELDHDAAIVIPIRTAKLPTLGWIPAETEAGAAGYLFLFPGGGATGVPPTAREGAMTRSAMRMEFK